MTRGATATRWKGPPAARRRGHNFTELPRIRSEGPAFALHHPHMIQRMPNELHIGREAVVGADEKRERTPTA